MLTSKSKGSYLKTNKIVVIGGGYAGLRTVEHLAKNKNNEIALFDTHPYHYMQTEVYDFIANEKDFSNITVDLFTFCKGFEDNVTFYKQEIVDVDFTNKNVLTSIKKHSYDYLVISTGSRTKFIDSIVGLKEYSYGIKSLHRALFFKQKFEVSLLNNIEEEGDYCKLLNIIVAGGGLSGVEIAAQMASYSKEFYSKNNFLCRNLNIVLIDACEHILPGLDKKLVSLSEQRLKDLDVIIKDNRMVVEVTKDSVKLNSGEILPMDFMIFAGGIEPNKFVLNLNIEKNEKNYIVTNEYLQSSSFPDVFAIGDCTTIYSDNIPLAPTADIAEQMAEHCAKNINNLTQDRPLIRHNIKSRGTLIALGRKYAVGKLFKMHIKGYLAYIVKKVVEKIYAKRLIFRSAKGSEKIFN